MLDVIVTTRHFEPAGKFRDLVEDKIRGSVEKYFPRAVEAHVTVSMEKHRYIAEVDIKISGVSFHAREETHDMHVSIDNAVSKLETQMRRYKEKRSGHKQKEIRAEDDFYQSGAENSE